MPRRINAGPSVTAVVDAVTDGSAGAPLVVMAVIVAVAGPGDPAGSVIDFHNPSGCRNPNAAIAVIAMTRRAVTAAAAQAQSRRPVGIGAVDSGGGDRKYLFPNRLYRSQRLSRSLTKRSLARPKLRSPRAARAATSV